MDDVLALSSVIAIMLLSTSLMVSVNDHRSADLIPVRVMAMGVEDLLEESALKHESPCEKLSGFYSAVSGDRDAYIRITQVWNGSVVWKSTFGRRTERSLVLTFSPEGRGMYCEVVPQSDLVKMGEVLKIHLVSTSKDGLPLNSRGIVMISGLVNEEIPVSLKGVREIEIQAPNTPGSIMVEVMLSHGGEMCTASSEVLVSNTSNTPEMMLEVSKCEVHASVSGGKPIRWTLRSGPRKVAEGSGQMTDVNLCRGGFFLNPISVDQEVILPDGSRTEVHGVVVLNPPRTLVEVGG